MSKIFCSGGMAKYREGNIYRNSTVNITFENIDLIQLNSYMQTPKPQLHMQISREEAKALKDAIENFL